MSRYGVVEKNVARGLWEGKYRLVRASNKKRGTSYRASGFILPSSYKYLGCEVVMDVNERTWSPVIHAAWQGHG